MAGRRTGGDATRRAARLRFRQCWIDRDNAVGLVRGELAALGVEQPDVVSVDLDGNDYHITEALLRGGLRPALVGGRNTTRASWPRHAMGDAV